MTNSQEKPLTYRVTNIAIQYVLHFNHKKFWQVKFDRNPFFLNFPPYLNLLSSGSKQSVIVECGKLLRDDQKDTTKIFSLSIQLPTLCKTLSSFNEVYPYSSGEIKDCMNQLINKKVQKGYQLLPIKSPQEIIPESNSSSNLGKRSNPNADDTTIQAEETSKKFHSNPLLPDHELSQEDHQGNPSKNIGAIEEEEEQVPQEDDKNNYGVIEEEHECEETAESTPKFIEEIHEVPPSIVSTQLQQDHNPPEVHLAGTNISNVNTQLFDEDDISYKEEEIQYEKTLTKEEFVKKVNSLGSSKTPFGKPIFHAHEFLTLPSEWEDEDPTGWYISKIRGGIRCVWNGFEMRTENGDLINLPEFYAEALPTSPLDGELEMKNVALTREEYQVAIGLEPEDENYDKIWINMMFVIYDAPGLSGSFEQRLEKLKEYFEDPEVAGGFVDVRLEDYKKCHGEVHAKSELEKALGDGGKGIRLTNPLGEYVKGVSKNVLGETKSRKLRG